LYSEKRFGVSYSMCFLYINVATITQHDTILRSYSCFLIHELEH
jgi:hypothetical protein